MEPHPDGDSGEVAEVSVERLRSSDAQESAAKGDPAAEAIANEIQEQVVRRQGLEDRCRAITLVRDWS